jgi:hypothetical protein
MGQHSEAVGDLLAALSGSWQARAAYVPPALLPAGMPAPAPAPALAGSGSGSGSASPSSAAPSEAGLSPFPAAEEAALWRLLGGCQLQLRRLAGAARSFRAALSLGADSAGLRASLARCLAYTGSHLQAAAEASAALRLSCSLPPAGQEQEQGQGPASSSSSSSSPPQQQQQQPPPHLQLLGGGSACLSPAESLEAAAPALSSLHESSRVSACPSAPSLLALRAYCLGALGHPELSVRDLREAVALQAVERDRAAAAREAVALSRERSAAASGRDRGLQAGRTAAGPTAAAAAKAEAARVESHLASLWSRAAGLPLAPAARRSSLALLQRLHLQHLQLAPLVVQLQHKGAAAGALAAAAPAAAAPAKAALRTAGSAAARGPAALPSSSSSSSSASSPAAAALSSAAHAAAAVAAASERPAAAPAA